MTRAKHRHRIVDSGRSTSFSDRLMCALSQRTALATSPWRQGGSFCAQFSAMNADIDKHNGGPRINLEGSGDIRLDTDS